MSGALEMTPPDFRTSRQALRAARVSDALGANRAIEIGEHRDRLLELLLKDSRREDPGFGALREDRVDTVVSLALAEVVEDENEALYVILVCVQVLAQDGQFARLTHLYARLAGLASQFARDRPFLAATLESLAETLRGNRGRGRRVLRSALGLDGRNVARISRDRATALPDLVCAGSYARWLESGEVGPLERAADVALRSRDGSMLALAEALLFLARASSTAETRRVLIEHDDTFDLPELADFLGQFGSRTLFPAQIEAIASGVTRPEDVVVALPTSSGKTFLALLRIVAQLTRAPESTVLYVAPYRLLANQVERELQDGLRRIGRSVRDIGGSFDPSIENRDEDFPDVAVCTPERLDALLRFSSSGSRRGADGAREFFDRCRLLIFDELHLIGRHGRGSRFELILARIKTRFPSWSILGLCAATHGVDELSGWLTGRKPIERGSRPTGTLELAWQPDGRIAQRVGSVRAFVGELPRRAPLDDAAALVLTLIEEYRPVLIIATSRPNAESVAGKLIKSDPAQGSRWRSSLSDDQRQEVEAAVEEVRLILGRDHKLAAQISQGVAYHHAGVPSHLLRVIERLASKRILRVLCATTTVAEGSDLPFRVVVIPMLNFEGGSTRRLQRDLYLNIVGRAGRAHVAMEGLVFILESSSQTLHDLVRRSLWASTQADRVSSRLREVSSAPMNLDQWQNYTELQGQILAWLGEGDNYLDNQASVFSAQTFGGSRNEADRIQIEQVVSSGLASLERDGLVLAGSPYRVTPLGESVRIGGLCARSTVRIRRALETQVDSWISELIGASSMSEVQTQLLAGLVFESLEVLQESYWLRRASPNEAGRWAIVRDLSSGHRDWPLREPAIEIDVALLAGWISGRSYNDLTKIAPIAERSNSLFGGTDSSKRTSDVSEYLGRVCYPAAWAWSAARAISGAVGEELPSFMRQAIELGVPTESACYLIRELGMTRPGALSVSIRAGDTTSEVLQWISSSDGGALIEIGLVQSDIDRINDASSMPYE